MFRDGIQLPGIFPMKIRSGLFSGIKWSLFLGFTVLASGLIIYFAGTNPFELLNIHIPNNNQQIVWLFVAGGLVSPVAEELFFRGVIFGYFRRWGFLFALVASTTIFAGLHTTPQIPWVQAAGGVLFAFSYEKSKNIITPIIIHQTGNMAIFTLGLIASTGIVT